MKITCTDVDRLLREEDSASRAALETHAESCPACRERLTAWSEISTAARYLQKEWESPHLWPKIRCSLEAEEAGSAQQERALGKSYLGLHSNWRIATAWACVILLSFATGLILSRNFTGRSTPEGTAEIRLLTDQALREIEASEAAYVQSIDKLARLAESRIAAPATPLMINYREKLLLVDQAIADCRVAIEQNHYNTHMRNELLAMYREKQETLQALMKENVNEPR
jgi:hypothetical protein